MKKRLLSLSPAEFCKATRACSDGAEFAAKYATMRDVWDNCQRVDWLVWMLNAVDAPRDEKKCRLFMVWCARNTPLADGRTTGTLLTDRRSLAALDVAARFANGNATQEELSAAWSAAEWAARSGSAAGSAAESAAWSAAWSAARSGSAAGSAAESAARSGSAAGSAAESAAWSAAESAQSAQFRKMVANPFISQK